MSSADTVPRYRAEDYTVGWLCALPLPELKAAKEMLDCQHARPLNIDENDSNWYEFGDIGQHKVVLASLNAFSPGTLSAQRLIQPLRQTFPNMVFHLFVGIGGGIPRRSATEDALGKRSRPKNALQDIHLGDVVVGWPEKTGAQAVINYDFYRSRGSEQGPELLSGLDKPDPRLVKALTPMISDREERTTNFHNHLRKLTDLEMFAYPGLEKDVLYESECAHSTDTDWVLDLGCRDCDAEMIVNRAERKWPEPQFHFGTILSGNRIVEDSRERDRLSDMYPGALCLEMEAAGVVDDTHCLVIRGISDYADSHRKSLGWHNYAAASAAAFAKEILYTLRPATTKTMKSQDRANRNQIHGYIERGSVLLRQQKHLDALFHYEQALHTLHEHNMSDPALHLKVYFRLATVELDLSCHKDMGLDKKLKHHGRAEGYCAMALRAAGMTPAAGVVEHVRLEQSFVQGRKAELEERKGEAGWEGATDAEEIKRVKLEASENIERAMWEFGAVNPSKSSEYQQRVASWLRRLSKD